MNRTNPEIEHPKESLPFEPEQLIHV